MIKMSAIHYAPGSETKVYDLSASSFFIIQLCLQSRDPAEDSTENFPAVVGIFRYGSSSELPSSRCSSDTLVIVKNSAFGYISWNSCKWNSQRSLDIKQGHKKAHVLYSTLGTVSRGPCMGNNRELLCSPMKHDIIYKLWHALNLRIVTFSVASRRSS